MVAPPNKRWRARANRRLHAGLAFFLRGGILELPTLIVRDSYLRRKMAVK